MKIVFTVMFFVVLYGIVCPYLVSYKSTEVVIFGILLGVFAPFVVSKISKKWRNQ
jgi:hypothetical protein